MFRNLDALPYYCIPREIMATTEETQKQCSAGSGYSVPDWILKSGQSNPMASIFSALPQVKVFVAQAEEADHSSLVAHLVAFPATAERYLTSQRSVLNFQDEGEPEPEATHDTFHYEHPDYADPTTLQKTSGRAKWAMRHGKAVRKKLKADKRGYIGS